MRSVKLSMYLLLALSVSGLPFFVYAQADNIAETLNLQCNGQNIGKPCGGPIPNVPNASVAGTCTAAKTCAVKTYINPDGTQMAIADAPNAIQRILNPTIFQQVGNFASNNQMLTMMGLMVGTQLVSGLITNLGSGSSGGGGGSSMGPTSGVCTGQYYYSSSPNPSDPCAVYSSTGGSAQTLPTTGASDTSLSNLLNSLNTNDGNNLNTTNQGQSGGGNSLSNLLSESAGGSSSSGANNSSSGSSLSNLLSNSNPSGTGLLGGTQTQVQNSGSSQSQSNPLSSILSNNPLESTQVSNSQQTQSNPLANLLSPVSGLNSQTQTQNPASPPTNSLGDVLASGSGNNSPNNTSTQTNPVGDVLAQANTTNTSNTQEILREEIIERGSSNSSGTNLSSTLTGENASTNTGGVSCSDGSTCGGGSYCSAVQVGKCIPEGRVDCGAYWCEAGTSCSPESSAQRCVAEPLSTPQQTADYISSPNVYVDATSAATPDPSQTDLNQKQIPVPAHGIQGDLRSFGGGVTLYGRNVSGNMSVSGFYGGKGGASELCRSRPWNRNFLSYVIPPAFFDSLCSLGGYPVGTTSSGGSVSHTQSGGTRPVQGPGRPVSATQSYIDTSAVPDVRIAASPPSVNLGGRTTVYWQTRNVLSCEQSSSDGNFYGTSLSGGASTVALSGPVTFRIVCRGRDGSVVEKSVTVEIGL